MLRKPRAKSPPRALLPAGAGQAPVRPRLYHPVRVRPSAAPSCPPPFPARVPAAPLLAASLHPHRPQLVPVVVARTSLTSASDAPKVRHQLRKGEAATSKARGGRGAAGWVSLSWSGGRCAALVLDSMRVGGSRRGKARDAGGLWGCGLSPRIGGRVAYLMRRQYDIIPQ